MLDIGAVLSETRESPPCGPNLEHDLSFFELEEAARGKPEQRIGDAVKPAEEPNWTKVIDLAQAMLLRSKDLRAAVHLTRASRAPRAFPGSPTGLSLIHGLLERYWDAIHPLLEADHDNDPTERLNALAPLVDPDAIVKNLRDSYLVNSREHGQLQARDVEIALGRLAPSRSARRRAEAAGPAPGPDRRPRSPSDRSVPSALREAHDRAAAIQALIGRPGRRDSRARPRAAAAAARLPARGLRDGARHADGSARTVPPRVSRCRVGRSAPPASCAPARTRCRCSSWSAATWSGTSPAIPRRCSSGAPSD